MAKNGLKNNLKPISILSIAKQAVEAAELRSKDRQRYSDSLLKYANLISIALKNKDINQLFELEKDAQEYDFFKTAQEDKRRDSLSALYELKEYWVRCQDKNYVVSKFREAHKNIGWATKPINDPTMKNGIQSQCRKISSIAGANKTPAEDLFYKKRQEALRLIEKEHIKMINEHLGLSKSKGLSR